MLELERAQVTTEASGPDQDLAVSESLGGTS
jgi:hypothetical protein